MLKIFCGEFWWNDTVLLHFFIAGRKMCVLKEENGEAVIGNSARSEYPSPVRHIPIW